MDGRDFTPKGYYPDHSKHSMNSGRSHKGRNGSSQHNSNQRSQGLGSLSNQSSHGSGVRSNYSGTAKAPAQFAPNSNAGHFSGIISPRGGQNQADYSQFAKMHNQPGYNR